MRTASSVHASVCDLHETSSFKGRGQAIRRAINEQARTFVRGAILDAAEEVILKHGCRAAKIVDVAKTAGVAVGTVYNHFTSKDALLNAIHVRCQERYFAAIQEETGGSDPIKRLEIFIERTLVFVADNRGLIVAGLRDAVAQAPILPRTVQIIDPPLYENAYQTKMAKLLDVAIGCGLLRDDLDLEESVWVLQSMLRGLVVSWLEIPDPTPLPVRGERLLRLFLVGAMRR